MVSDLSLLHNITAMNGLIGSASYIETCMILCNWNVSQKPTESSWNLLKTTSNNKNIIPTHVKRFNLNTSSTKITNELCMNAVVYAKISKMHNLFYIILCPNHQRSSASLMYLLKYSYTYRCKFIQPHKIRITWNSPLHICVKIVSEQICEKCNVKHYGEEKCEMLPICNIDCSENLASHHQILWQLM